MLLYLQVLQVETVRSGPVDLVVPLSLSDPAHRVDPLNPETIPRCKKTSTYGSFCHLNYICK